MNELIPACPPQHEVRRRIERIESKIYQIRGQKVMLDFDLAALYGVPTKVLNQAVKRNIERFPDDFIFSLSRQEISSIAKCDTFENQKLPPLVAKIEGEPINVKQ
jgi:hypothetical protein